MGWLRDFASAVSGDSQSKVSQAHHQARDDSGVREGRDTEHFKSAPSWAETKTESGISYFPEGKESSSGTSEKK